MHDLLLVTVSDDINVPVEHAEPLITGINNLTDSVEFVKSIKLKKAPYEMCHRFKMRFGKFPVIVPATLDMEFSEVNENNMTFENPGLEGSVVPFSGAFEWSKMDSNKDATFFITSLMLRVGPDANFLVHLVNKVLPDCEAALNFSGWSIVPMEQRKKWIEKTYKDSSE